MQFVVEEVHAARPWAIRNKSGNQHASKFFTTQAEAEIFAQAMNKAWEQMERKSFTRAIQWAEQALTPQA